MSDLRLQARRLSKALTKVIGARWGESFPFYYVCEHPKSGGTWLAQMVADSLRVPFLRESLLPIGCRSVILAHWRPDPRLRRVLYLYRDGRDVVTSLFFHRLRFAQNAACVGGRRQRARLERVFGRGYDAEDTARLLPRFVDHEFRRPGPGSRLNWREHLEAWGVPGGRPHVAYLSYEALRRDPVPTLSRALAEVTGAPIDPRRVTEAVGRYSMESVTGRRAGEEDRGHHVRKGIVGDWRSHFTRECAEVFRHHAGDLLVRLGYEVDDRWVDEVDGPGARQRA